MKIYRGNILLRIGKAPAICITTNGFVTSNNKCVMGRGIAKQISDLYPEISTKLGNLIRQNGNIVQVITNINGTDIIAFPVKPITSSDNSKLVRHMIGKINTKHIPGWAVKADINIICESTKQLAELIRLKNYKYVCLPKPGCGAGELSWDEVKSKIKDIISDNIIICTL
ncbi:MAG: hypothetical protein ACOC33_02560 [bacterium]